MVAMSGEPLGSTLGALDAGTGKLIVSTSPTETSSGMIGLYAAWTGDDPRGYA